MMRFKQFLILAACLLALPLISRADAPALRAIATADYTEVHPENVFEVTLSLQNLTGTVQRIKMPQSNWDRLWKSSNRHVTWDAWDSDDQTETTVEIGPHETYEFPKTLRMFVDDSVKESHLDFRMGFRAARFGKIVWTAPITLDVIP